MQSTEEVPAAHRAETFHCSHAVLPRTSDNGRYKSTIYYSSIKNVVGICCHHMSVYFL